MNKVSLILFLVAWFCFFIQLGMFVSGIAAIRAGHKGKVHVSLITGWIALTCAIAGVVLK